MESISVSNNSNPIPILKKTKRRPSSLHRTPRNHSKSMEIQTNHPHTFHPPQTDATFLPEKYLERNEKSPRREEFVAVVPGV